jgi:acetoacetyl-[acyl-carrier protein] synthase
VSRLPVIVGLGGVNPAGRVSFHHAYRRLVIDELSKESQQRTYNSLAALMNLQQDPTRDDVQAFIRDHTLIRKIESFDVDRVLVQRRASLRQKGEGGFQFVLARQQLPGKLPEGWHVEALGERDVCVSVDGPLEVLLRDSRTSKVSSAGQLPTGFNPGSLYQARSHPRGLQLAVYGGSDALQSVGVDLKVLKQRVKPDQFAVYSSSAMGQLDAEGFGGLLQNPMLGKRPSAKNTALGLNEMPADFINAYVLGSVGTTAGIVGACATFLYNLKQGAEDIRSGRSRVVFVGNAEAPIVPDVIEGYRVMGALAEDEALMALDGLTGEPDHRRACRPFAENCGFTVAESSVYTVLFDDELALELGAEIYGSVGDVFVNADGYKKSIPGPGIGNYITFGKAMGLARSILGERALRTQTYVQAHGTGTPANRTTESHVLNELAKSFGIERWTVGAIKAYLGHSMAPAGGDQLAAILGAWHEGWIPGIKSIDRIADDVHDSNLHFPLEDLQFAPRDMAAAFINSKGFGGNNSTALILSPYVTEAMLETRWGRGALTAHAERRERVRAATLAYDESCLRGEARPLYKFGEGVLSGEDLEISDDRVRLPGYEKEISFRLENPYPDMTE